MPWEFFDRPAAAVESNIAAMNARADTALATTLGVAGSLAAIELPGDGLTPANFSLPAIIVPSAVTPEKPRTAPFGEIQSWREPEVENIAGDVGLDPDLANLPTEFNPTVGDPQFPDPPEPIDTSGEPTRPTVATVTMPTRRSRAVIPSPPTLDDIVLPSFTPLNLPTFTDTAPEFTDAAPNPTLIWHEPEYESEVLDEIKARVRAMLAGGTGLPAAVQQALFDAARGREDLIALAAEQDAYDEFAARGFSMPPGALAKSLQATRERSRLSASAFSRDLLTKAAQWEIENLRAAVTNGVALEGLLQAKFNNLASRVFDAAKYQLEIETKVHELAIAAFNARNSAFATKAVVFRARMDGELGRLQEMRAEIDIELARGQRNEQKIRQYLGELDGVNKEIESFNLEMRGAEIQANINRSVIEGHSVDVQAWGEKLKARKAPHEAYELTMRGEAVRATALEAQTRGFAETVRAAEAQANVKIKWVDARISANRAETERYVARLQAERERVQADLGAIQARTAAFSADVGRYGTELQGANQARAQEIQLTELRLSNNLAYWSTTLREYDAALGRQIERAKIVLGGLDAAARTGAALTTGAMSALHMTATMAGHASVSDSVSLQTQISRQGGDVA